MISTGAAPIARSFQRSIAIGKKAPWGDAVHKICGNGVSIRLEEIEAIASVLINRSTIFEISQLARDRPPGTNVNGITKAG